ncbi:hypothetical protein SAVCW2_58810 [Streptomyces avermitilis]|nr:hypothetical protein SAVCW2_58810 [Streptomyces avermitilis]
MTAVSLRCMGVIGMRSRRTPIETGAETPLTAVVVWDMGVAPWGGDRPGLRRTRTRTCGPGAGAVVTVVRWCGGAVVR